MVCAAAVCVRVRVSCHRIAMVHMTSLVVRLRTSGRRKGPMGEEGGSRYTIKLFTGFFFSLFSHAKSRFSAPPPVLHFGLGLFLPLSD